MRLSMFVQKSPEASGSFLRNSLRRLGLAAAAFLVLSPYGRPALADTLTGTFSNLVFAGNELNNTGPGSLTYTNNQNTAVVGTATPGGASCSGSNKLCWGTGPDLGIAASEQYSELTFTGSTLFNPKSSLNQSVGTILFMNGTSDLDSVIFGATLSFFDNGVAIGSDNVVISTTQNQYSGTGLTPAQLQIDADYINICGNDSNICSSSAEAYESSQGGTGLLAVLQGKLIGDPTLVLNSINVDPSQAGCTTCGIIGDEPALAETPEPSSLVLLATGMFLLAVFSRRAVRSSKPARSLG